jgi:hypothetical protein
MIELLILQHMAKITVIALGVSAACIWKTQKPKPKTEIELLLERFAEIEERIKNRGF